MLIKSGAMDKFGEQRAALIATMDAAMQAADQHSASVASGQIDVFGEVEAPVVTTAATVTEWSERERLAAEKETLGLYLTGHPYSQFRDELAGVARPDIRAMDLSTEKFGIFAGMVFSIRAVNTRRGKMGFAVLDNAGERVEVILPPDKFKHYQTFLQVDGVLVAYGKFGIDEYENRIQLRADAAADLATFRNDCLRRIHLTLTEKSLTKRALKSLSQTLTPARGGNTAIAITYHRNAGETGTITPGPTWQIHPTQPAIDTLTAWSETPLKFTYETAPLIPAKQTSRNNGGWRR